MQQLEAREAGFATLLSRCQYCHKRTADVGRFSCVVPYGVVLRVSVPDDDIRGQALRGNDIGGM